MAKVVGIRFKSTAKVYYFAPTENYYEEGSGVIVETAKGLEYAEVAFGIKEVPDKDCVMPLKPIVRKATAKEIELYRNHMENSSLTIQELAYDIMWMQLNSNEFLYNH